MLNANDIINQAEETAGIADSDANVRRNLERLVDALHAESRMSPRGFEITQRGLVSRTVDRLEGMKWLRDYPEIANEPIDRPVFLTGLPRSGTTYFQYLFDRDPRYRMIRTWEGLSPSPPPAFDPQSAALRKSEWNERRRAAHPPIKGFDALHLYDEDGSEECHTFLEQSFGAAGLNNLFRVPSYFDYLVDELDMEATYRVHKRQLQLLQWRSPPRPWAVKYPNHVLAMPEILTVYPDARFVMTHRDPVQTLASIANMSLKLREVRSDEPIDAHDVGQYMLKFVQRHIDRIMEFTSGPDAGKVTHIDYYALLNDPATEMQRAHTGLGIDSPQEVRDAVAQWRKDNPKNARGANPYAIEQFGLNGDAVAEQFGDYMRRFNIPRERDGLARIGAVT